MSRNGVPWWLMKALANLVLVRYVFSSDRYCYGNEILENGYPRNPDQQPTSLNPIKEARMPVITMSLGQGQTTKEQKKQLIENFTETAMEILKLPAQSFTILIHELSTDNIGVGGNSLENLLEKRQA
jgi:4-oxalocrotonate tautomerase